MNRCSSFNFTNARVVGTLALLLAMPATVIGGSIGTGNSGTSGGTSGQQGTEVSFGGQQPPPPSLTPYLRDFIDIYTPYTLLPDDSERYRRPCFLTWCVMHRVNDPRRLRAYDLLYEWAVRNGIDPRRFNR